MRLFIAIALPDYIKEKTKEAVSVLKRCPLDAKWVKTENLHLTLKFLGEAEEDTLEEIKKNMASVAAHHVMVAVRFENFGFFPNEKNPRVFFMATDKEEILKKIAADLEEALEKIGFTKDDRFKSHLTLCRFRSAKNIACLMNELKNVNLSGRTFEVNSITLYKSTLTPHGPIYEEIFKANLAK